MYNITGKCLITVLYLGFGLFKLAFTYVYIVIFKWFSDIFVWLKKDVILTRLLL